MLNLSLSNVAVLPFEDQETLALLLAELRKRDNQRKFHDLFPDSDIIIPGAAHDGGDEIIHARDKYQKHLEFFRVSMPLGERFRNFVFRERSYACLLSGLEIGRAHV